MIVTAMFFMVYFNMFGCVTQLHTHVEISEMDMLFQKPEKQI